MKTGKIIHGPAQIESEEGLYEINGAFLEAPFKISLSSGRTAVLKTIKSGTDYFIRPQSAIKYEVDIENLYPEAWDTIIGELGKAVPTRVLVVGDTDSGKSFFCLYCANRLLDKYSRIGIIDCDLGQSDIGPPGCLGSVIMTKPSLTLHDLTPHQLYFIGAVSPEGQISSMFMGLERLLTGLADLVDLVIINTCGYTQGDPARVLKLGKVSLFRPDLVLILSQEDRFRWLSDSFPGIESRYVTVSKYCRKVSQSQRKENRNTLNRHYFETVDCHTVSFDDIKTCGCYFRTGTPVPKSQRFPFLYGERYNEHEGSLFILPADVAEHDIEELKSVHPNSRIKFQGDEKGVVIGLLDRDQYLMGLGIIEGIDYEKGLISFYTPLKDVRPVSIISFGTMKYSLWGEEAGFIHPGSF